jgi:colanic acid/amylovoran biosynthesis glycosyltransferase
MSGRSISQLLRIMRIAHFVDCFPSVSETFILNQLTGLLDRGHDVEVFAVRAGDPKVVHADVHKYGLVEKTHYHGIEPQPRALQKALWVAQSRKGIVRLLRRRPRLIAAPRLALSPSLWRKTQLLNGACGAFDAVHCHFGPNGTLAASLRELTSLEGPIVTSFYGYDLSMFVRAHGPDVYRFLFAHGDLFLPISRRFKRQLIDLGCPPEKIVVHHLGVNANRFPAKTYGNNADPSIGVLTIARLVEKKGVAYGIEAVARLAGRYPQLHYQIVGDGPLRPALEDLIGRRGLTSRVKLMGWKSQEEVAGFLRQADILLAPSVTGEDGDEEGTPTVLIEALAHGIPVISTYHGAIAEVVPDGQAGFLVPERDAGALAEKLAHTIERRQWWPAMGAAGRKYVQRYYDVQKLNDQLVDIYRRVAPLPRCAAL